MTTPRLKSICNQDELRASLNSSTKVGINSSSRSGSQLCALISVRLFTNLSSA